MRHYYILLIVAILILSLPVAKAQNSGYDALIKGSIDDATKLVNAYGKPVIIGLGVGANGGWYNTAKTKKLLHFELRVSASNAFVPTSDQSFDVTKIGLSNHVGPADPSQIIAPTVAGNQNNLGPLMNVYAPDQNGVYTKVGQFNTSSGKTSFFPTPQVQVTIGFLKNTDVTIRAIPLVNIGGTGYSISTFGVGLRHDILQDFTGKANKLIPFDLAIAVAYSKLNLNIPVSVQPGNSAFNQPANSQQNNDFSNQKLNGDFSNIMAQVIISKKLLFFTPFAAIGFNNTHVTVGTTGNFPLTTSTSDGLNYYSSFQNVVNISETSVNGFRADLGFQLSLGFFNIYVSGSQSQYTSVNGGIGIAF